MYPLTVAGKWTLDDISQFCYANKTNGSIGIGTKGLNFIKTVFEDDTLVVETALSVEENKANADNKNANNL